MSRRSLKTNNASLFIGFLIVSIAVQILPHQITSNLNSFFVELFSPVISLRIDIPQQFLRTTSPGEQWVSRQEYDQLWTAYKNIYADLLEEHERLETIAKFRSHLPKSGAGLVAAKVIRKEQGHFLLINRGSLDGVSLGQYVMSNGLIIGTITEVSTATARITLLVNNSQNMEVRILKRGGSDYIRANLRGDGISGSKIPLVSRELDVKPGDLVYASPRPQYLDTPRLIGEITEVNTDIDNPLLWDISVSQPIDYDKIDELAVIVIEKPMEAGR